LAAACVISGSWGHHGDASRLSFAAVNVSPFSELTRSGFVEK
jgi:hypothetical protein